MVENIFEQLKTDDNGLIAAVVQDWQTNEVLMVAWMDKEALRRTLAEGKACYYSRSRQKYWVKGESSGHFQFVRELRTDCDVDAVILKVEQVGAACHNGYRSCFYRTADSEGNMQVVETQLMTEEEIYGKK